MSKMSDFMGWVDHRIPLTATFEKHMSKYYAPKNFNFWYFFGVFAVSYTHLTLPTIYSV